ncbi:type II toxin-antitoxin system VapC family toxin [Agrobacterium larrymoorei]|uniref:Ribonuclease VapC n=1 Tax=Agrobacterium larrymoorei TaxID=160699 RepID=A0A4D7DYZ0_9HYPH|nr:type II toxin-antitoxin system VapC family toxin [Agrobacterium larrymoorei]QCI97000.1 type II toxin-antitoxin system VapC family toxin [Agrobacterium larrymoorei]QYA07573.1 type II toxin-antitoxin system VapC family toxin [Agrobacterium larrymoorei]
MRYLLDTNAISHVIDFPRGSVAQRIRTEAVTGTLVTSVIVVAELRYGYTKISSRRLRDAYETFFESLPIENWEAPFDHVYADIRDQLTKKGRSIGAMDMLIAAHALATDAVVVTANIKHFSEVPGLKVENWLR